MPDAQEAKHEKYPFYVDAKRYESEKGHLSGGEVKAQAGAPAEYQLYEEEEGDQPDRAISDGETVDLKGRVRHFYAVPPATFG